MLWGRELSHVQTDQCTENDERKYPEEYLKQRALKIIESLKLLMKKDPVIEQLIIHDIRILMKYRTAFTTHASHTREFISILNKTD